MTPQHINNWCSMTTEVCRWARGISGRCKKGGKCDKQVVMGDHMTYEAGERVVKVTERLKSTLRKRNDNDYNKQS